MSKYYEVIDDATNEEESYGYFSSYDSAVAKYTKLIFEGKLARVKEHIGAQPKNFSPEDNIIVWFFFEFGAPSEKDQIRDTFGSNVKLPKNGFWYTPTEWNSFKCVDSNYGYLQFEDMVNEFKDDHVGFFKFSKKEPIINKTTKAKAEFPISSGDLNLEESTKLIQQPHNTLFANKFELNQVLLITTKKGDKFIATICLNRSGEKYFCYIDNLNVKQIQVEIFYVVDYKVTSSTCNVAAIVVNSEYETILETKDLQINFGFVDDQDKYRAPRTNGVYIYINKEDAMKKIKFKDIKLSTSINISSSDLNLEESLFEIVK